MNSEIYLDANATSPVLPAAIQASQGVLLACFGNPSSSHAAGLRARALLDDARSRARRVLGARAAGLPCGDLLLYGATEHKAVPESLAHWNALLGTLVCTMAANNETGVVSGLDGIAAVLEETGSDALWMVDCVQALGKLPLALSSTRIDYAPFSGHKLYAPKGIGMLYVRAGAPYAPLMCGGGQEEGQRSGTENMAGIAALGAVLRALEEGRTFRSHAQMTAARERLAAALCAAFPGIVFNAPFDHALPTTLNFTVPGRSGNSARPCCMDARPTACRCRGFPITRPGCAAKRGRSCSSAAAASAAPRRRRWPGNSATAMCATWPAAWPCWRLDRLATGAARWWLSNHPSTAFVNAQSRYR